MAADSLKDLTDRIYGLEDEISNLEIKLSKVKLDRQKSVYEKYGEEFDEATKPKPDALYLAYATDGAKHVDPEYEMVLYKFEGMLEKVQLLEVRLYAQVGNLQKSLKDQLNWNTTASSRKFDDIAKNFDRVQENDEFMIKNLSRLLTPPPNFPRLHVESKDGTLLHMWVMRLWYLKEERNDLVFPGSRLGQYLAKKPSRLYNMLVEIIRIARTIHEGYRQYKKALSDEQFISYPYVKDLIAMGDDMFKSMLRLSK